MKLKELFESNNITDFSRWSEFGKNFKSLTQLIDLPEKIHSDFYAGSRYLISLEGGPLEVNGNYDCTSNNLSNLIGAPKILTGSFDCSKNNLNSLQGCPQIIHDFFRCNKNRLRNFIGGPVSVSGFLSCSSNPLESFEGAPTEIGRHLICQRTDLKNLKDIHKHIRRIGGGAADFTFNSINSHVVGLLLIDGLNRVLLDNKKVEEIINKHLSNGRDVLACIEELEEAGFSQFAKI